MLVCSMNRMQHEPHVGLDRIHVQRRGDEDVDVPCHELILNQVRVAAYTMPGHAIVHAVLT